MKRHRKDGYWAAYHAAQPTQKDFVVGFVKDVVRKNPPPEPPRESPRGRKRLYPAAEMAIVCILMNHFNLSCHKAEAEIKSWDLDLAGASRTTRPSLGRTRRST